MWNLLVMHLDLPEGHDLWLMASRLRFTTGAAAAAGGGGAPAAVTSATTGGI